MSSSAGKFYSWRPAAALVVTGPDAFTFLQGQFTNDLRKLDQEGTVYGLWLDHRGHVQADSFVCCRPKSNGFLVCSYFSPGSVIAEKLNSHLIADDVTIEDRTDRWMGLTSFDGAETGPIGEGAIRFAARRGIPGAFEFFWERKDAETAACAEYAGAATDLEMERFRIEAGIPRIPLDIGPGELPNEAGLDDDAVSHTKGCYLGQEVVARLRSTGRVRRRLFRVSGSGGLPPPRTKLFQGRRTAGEIRSSVVIGDGFAGLALLGLHRPDLARPLALREDGAEDVRILPLGGYR